MPTDTTITSLGEPTDSRIDEALEGLDVLDLGGGRQRGLARRLWSAAWPKLAAVVIALGLWQLVVWSGWKPTYALAPPSEAFADLWEMIKDGTLAEATLLTMRRAAIGFALGATAKPALWQFTKPRRHGPRLGREDHPACLAGRGDRS